MSLLTSSSTTGGLYLYLPYLSNRLCGKVTTYLGTVQVSVVATRLPPVAATATAAARERNATYRSRRVPEISHKASFLIMQAKSSRSSTLSGPSESCDAYRTGWEKKRVGTTSGIEAFTLLGIVTSLAHPIRAPILGNLLIPVNIKWVPSERGKKGSTFFPVGPDLETGVV